jgi:hypothetical protein
MPISSNTLFHFTNSVDNLISILENDFVPHYSFETYSTILPFCKNREELNKIAIPIVCFCDLPLANVQNHLEVYGNYGIGLSKECGGNKNINPIIYLEKDSKLSKTLNENLRRNYREGDFKNFFEIISYIKPYSGMFTKHDKTKFITYYNEREWRYVPNIEGGDYSFFFRKDGSLAEQTQWDEMQKYKLRFEPDDVKYLIVEDDNEVLNLVRKIERIKGAYSLNSITGLKSRILTSKKILSDF